MEKKATIYDIAKALDITVSTVSRALRDLPVVSKATRKAVAAMAEKMNYMPNTLASALKSGKTFIIGVIVPSVQSHFFASIIHSIEEGLKDSGYRILLYQTNELYKNEVKGVRTLLEAQVDGVIASLSLETDDVSHFTEILQINKPLILFDRISEKLMVPTVTLNDFKAGFLAANHLLDRGFKKIAFLTTDKEITIFRSRLEGYKHALESKGLPINPEHIIYGGLSIKDGRYAVGKLFRNVSTQPDAIIAGDDFTALGAVKKLKEIGLTPPVVGVMGFANEVFSPYLSPSLSTVDQHPNQMGLACAAMFLEMLKRKTPFDKIKNVIIEPTIVDRQSTGTFI